MFHFSCRKKASFERSLWKIPVGRTNCSNGSLGSRKVVSFEYPYRISVSIIKARSNQCRFQHCTFSRTSGMGGSIRSSGNNQHKEGSNQYKKESCYILQDDRLAPLFTVGEIMNMAADLKLGYSLSEKAKQLVVSI